MESNYRKFRSHHKMDTVEERRRFENTSYHIPARAFRIDSYRKNRVTSHQLVLMMIMMSGSDYGQEYCCSFNAMFFVTAVNCTIYLLPIEKIIEGGTSHQRYSQFSLYPSCPILDFSPTALVWWESSHHRHR